MSPAPLTAPFILFSSFTSNPANGNPVAVVSLPTPCLPAPSTEYPTEKLQAIATNFNQPITAFISPLLSSKPGEKGKVDYAIRWFTINSEIQICGHGLLAATKAILADPTFGEADNEKAFAFKSRGAADITKFLTIADEVVSARKATVSLSGSTAPVEHIQITFPQCLPQEIKSGSPEFSKIISALSIALQKAADEIDVKYIGHGEGTFAPYVIIELGEAEGLDGKIVIADAFRETGYTFNILTSTSAKAEETYVTRNFAPTAGLPEDHVSGSPHCLLGPYWAGKRAASGTSVETPMSARVPSARGGNLLIQWDNKEGKVIIGGEVVAWARGEITL